jgi:hypothetical protein
MVDSSVKADDCFVDRWIRPIDLAILMKPEPPKRLRLDRNRAPVKKAPVPPKPVKIKKKLNQTVDWETEKWRGI